VRMRRRVTLSLYCIIGRRQIQDRFPDEANVYAELCQIVEEWIETMKARGQPLPPTTIRRNIVGKILSEVSGSREGSS
jgi:hypothetical protein